MFEISYLYKLLSIIFLYLISYKKEEKKKRIPTIYCILGIYLLVNNLSQM